MEQYEDIRMRCDAARAAARRAAEASARSRGAAIKAIADRLLSDSELILDANRHDIEAAQGQLAEHMIERLHLDETRIGNLCDELLALAAAPDPLGMGTFGTRPSGLEIARRRVPLGAIAFVYDCRPELAVRAVAMCIKTANAAIISPSYASVNTDAALVDIMCDALEGSAYPHDAVCYIDPTLADVPEMLGRMRGSVDLIVCGGERGLRDKLAEGTVPVMMAGNGISHIYIDESCDVQAAVKATVRSIYPRNVETSGSVVVLVHKRAAQDYLGAMYRSMQPYHPEYRACPASREYLSEAIPAVRDDWSAQHENTSNTIAVRVVESMDEAIAHINTYGTAHADAIMTTHMGRSKKFVREVDSTTVCVNAALKMSDTVGAGGILAGVELEALTGEKCIISGDVAVTDK
ncbi:MAG: aldehyde dehydrogenase family protein [Clostridia bacterium]|nr:aldehyde dehydrogenase family protein [Clostridia bacterium]